MAATSGPDQFPLGDTHPRAPEHERLGSLLEEAPSYVERVSELMRGRQLLRSVPRGAAAPLVTAALERAAHLRERLAAEANPSTRARAWYGRMLNLVHQLAPQAVPKQEAELALLLRLASELPHPAPRDRDAPRVAQFTPALRHFLDKAGQPIEAHPQLQTAARALLEAQRELATHDQYEVGHYRELVELIGDEVEQLLAPGEVWADAVLADLATMDEGQRARWHALVTHCRSATASKPSKRWQSQALPLLLAVGHDEARARLVRWLPLVAKGRSQPLPPEERGYGIPDDPGYIIEAHQLVLRGLAWCASWLPDQRMARALGTLARTSYRKLRGHGPRSTKLGNAALWALGNMPGRDGAAQLRVLEAKLEGKSAKKKVAHALATAAAREGITPDQLEQLAAAANDLRNCGESFEQFGDHHAVVQIVDSAMLRLRWRGPTGELCATVPSAVERDHGEQIADLRVRIEDIAALLADRRDRLEQRYRHDHSWAYSNWCSECIDHPLVSALARRLIWRASCGDEHIDLLWRDGSMRDLGGAPPPAWFGVDAHLRLWHPLGETPESVSVWRDLLESAGIHQPFAQVQRELYTLRDDERERDHSLRVADRILRQHPFHALSNARGWNNPLRLSIDDTYTAATLAFPAHRLRAELWVHGAGSYADDTTRAGTYIYLQCQQLRFHQLETPPSHAHAVGGDYQQPAAPIPLAEIPPRVFSEVMREVELLCRASAVSDAPES